MGTENLDTPVVLLVFNRPEATAQVLKTIREVKPKQLFVVADGPRIHRPSDIELCRETRETLSAIDWPCEISTRFSETNLGCRANVSTGLDWVFEHVEEAIILEDDCLPDVSFFPFCEELLALYRDNLQVAQICGSNYQQGQCRTQFSYYFSRHSHIWGWATWRRSWRWNDLTLSDWPELRKKNWLKGYTGNTKAAFYWTKLFNDSYNNDLDSLNSWAIPWTYSCWKRGAVSVIPNVNLVENIGYGHEGTHTSANATANLTASTKMAFPLVHPTEILPDRVADLFTEKTFYYGQNFWERLFWAMRIPVPVAWVRRVRRMLKELFS